MPCGYDLEAVYDAHAGALFSFLLNLTRNIADTKDLLQELFIRLARNPHCLDGVKEQRKFLLRMAHNLAVDFFSREEARKRAGERLNAEPVELFTRVALSTCERQKSNFLSVQS